MASVVRYKQRKRHPDYFSWQPGNEVNPLHAAKVQNPSIFSEREEEVITVVYGTHAADTWREHFGICGDTKLVLLLCSSISSVLR